MSRSSTVPIRLRRRAVLPSSARGPRPASALTIVEQPLTALSPAKRQVRRRGKGQVDTLKANIERFGLRVPILVTEAGEIVDGHAIFEACQALGLDTVPTLVVDGLSENEIRALRLALNKIAEASVWSLPDLKVEFEHLFSVDPSLVPFTAFAVPEIDALLAMPLAADPEQELSPSKGPAVSRQGDLWEFTGGHRLLCGNAREEPSYRALLLPGEQVQMVLSDPPYGCKISGHVSRSHGEFVEGSGMDDEEALEFFQSFLGAMTPHLRDGAIVDLFIDWRGMMPLLSALRAAGLEQKSLCVWDKQSGGMGSLYRQQTEYVVIAKWGKAPHINHIALGKYGRNRTTLWAYPGLARLQKGRSEALAMHPTIKPLGLLTDALLDTSDPGGVVLDPFVGSGSLLLAAHRTKRIGRGMELDPAYVDVAVRRMEAFTGAAARLSGTDKSFAEIERERRLDPLRAA